jgi:uncharacterized protein YjdB
MSYKSFLSKVVVGAALTLFLAGCGDNEDGAVVLQSINVSPPSLALNPGQKGQLTATAVPADAENISFKWSSSDHTKATVSSTGEVTAVAEGTATVTVISGSITKDVTVTVTLSVMTSFTVAPERLSLTLGDYPTDLTVTRVPAGAGGVFTYVSSDDNVVTVVDGEVTAIDAGEATITVSSGSLPPKVIPVTVVLPPLASFTVEPLNLAQGAEKQLVISKTPILADPTFAYQSANGEIVTVSENGTVSATGLGSTTITVTSDNNLTQTVQVTVVPPDATFDKDNWTVTASGASGNHVADLLIDNTRHSYWQAVASETPASFVVDMHGYKSWNGFYLYHPYAAAVAASPKAITIETSSDNIIWKTVHTADNLNETKDVIRLDLAAPVVARYFKVTITGLNQSAAGAYLAEIGIYSEAEPYNAPTSVQYYFEHIYPCGDVFSWGWEPSVAAELTTDGNGVYVWEGPLTSDGTSEDAFKILTVRDWGGHNIRPLVEWAPITNNSVQAIDAVQNANDNLKWKLYSSEGNGTWRITVDLAEMLILFEKLN